MSQFIVYTIVSTVIMINATNQLQSWDLYRRYGPLPTLLSALIVIIWLALYFFAASRVSS